MHLRNPGQPATLHDLKVGDRVVDFNSIVGQV